MKVEQRKRQACRALKQPEICLEENNSTSYCRKSIEKIRRQKQNRFVFPPLFFVNMTPETKVIYFNFTCALLFVLFFCDTLKLPRVSIVILYAEEISRSDPGLNEFELRNTWLKDRALVNMALPQPTSSSKFLCKLSVPIVGS